MSKIACLHAKSTWFSNAKAYFNIPLRFSTTYVFFNKGASAPQALPPMTVNNYFYYVAEYSTAGVDLGFAEGRG